MLGGVNMKFIDFFAGIGGFRLGMEMAGHECVGYCEIDKFAQKSYIAMHRPSEKEWFTDDIRKIQPEEIPEADCYCGGFPCQSFSVAGKRGGFEDTRGTLFFEIMRLARIRKPKCLFLENVKGLLSHNGGRTFGTILSVMGECGYDAEWQVLNSKNFGVPQNRERVFIIGHLRGASRPKVFPVTGTNGKNLRQIIGGSQAYRVYSTDGISCTLTGETGGLGAKTGLYFINQPQFDKYEENGIYQTLRVGGDKPLIKACLTPDRVNKRQAGRRLKEVGEPMFTITAQDRHGVFIGDEGSTMIRRLTPKECFRLQGFPDEYFERAREVNSDNQLYKQAGNSVTVNVVYAIAQRLDNQLL